jgi:predicted negative regulator of RcsB-dependent stress response
METYSSEEERLEAVQRWWKENSSSVITGLALGAAAIFGWNMWQGNKAETARQASILFQQMSQATEAKQADSATKLGERILNQYGSSAYAEYARLLLARLKAEAGDLPGARKFLEEELAKSGDEQLQHLARLRLGRVLLASGEVEPGLKLIEPYTAAKVGKFQGLYEELRGDLLVAAKRPEEARAAYLKAKEAGEPTPILDLKLNDLPQATAP